MSGSNAAVKTGAAITSPAADHVDDDMRRSGALRGDHGQSDVDETLCRPPDLDLAEPVVVRTRSVPLDVDRHVRVPIERLDVEADRFPVGAAGTNRDREPDAASSCTGEGDLLTALRITRKAAHTPGPEADHGEPRPGAPRVEPACQLGASRPRCQARILEQVGADRQGRRQLQWRRCGRRGFRRRDRREHPPAARHARAAYIQRQDEEQHSHRHESAGTAAAVSRDRCAAGATAARPCGRRAIVGWTDEHRLGYYVWEVRSWIRAAGPRPPPRW
jgi:hypothetical protein